MNEVVESEIQKIDRQDRAGKLVDYLNNFYLKIPGSSGDNLHEVSSEFFGQRTKMLLDMQRRRIDLYRGKDETEEHFAQEGRETGYSDKYIFGTEQQFKEDIKTAIEQSDIDKNALAQYIDGYIQESRGAPKHSKYDPELYERLILPVYIKLREMGYSRQDLIV